MSDAMKSIMAGYHPSITLPQPGIDRTSPPSSDEDKEKVCKDFESFMLYSYVKIYGKNDKNVEERLRRGNIHGYDV